MAVTPLRDKVAKPASSGKMKQMSLMSFFKPQAQKSSPVKTESEKDDERSEIHSTPSTSDTEPPVSQIKHKMLDSSPLKRVKSQNKDKKRNTEQAEEKKITQETPSATVDVKASTIQSSPVAGNGKRRAAAARSISYTETDSEAEDDVKSGRKKRRIVDSDDEDEDEFKLDDAAEDDDDDDMSDFIVPDEDEDDVAGAVSDDDEDEIVVKSSKKKTSSNKKRSSSPQEVTPTKKYTPSSSSNGALGEKFNSGSSYSASTTTPSSSKTAKQSIATSSPAFGRKNFTKENEERYQWLVNIKDANKNPIDHPDYDSRTLYVPQSAWSKFTNFEKQYWEIKSKMWDTVVFFKKGKFYELYENDAMIANSKFDLKIAGGGRANMKLAGVPEMSFEYWAKEFVSNGYKVAKVDQVETLLAKEMRGNEGGKEEKIIKRELTSVLTGGTLTDLNMITDDMAIYCLSIKQEGKKFGIAFVDTSTSELQLIEIEEEDIDECSKLDTIITQIKPKEIICEKNNLSTIPMKILKSSSSSGIIWNYLNPESEFWDYDTTLEELVKSRYYPADDLDDYKSYPEVLIKFKDEKTVGFTAFGGLLHYLKNLKLDESIMTMKNIHEYDMQKSSSTTNLLLDGITLSNLEILTNTFDGTDRGTLFKLTNRAITSFGKRMLKNWILNPLYRTEDINRRYDSVEYLMNNGEFRDVLERGLGDIPDLERLIARVHGKTLRFRDFLRVVEGFERIERLVMQLKGYDLEGTGSLKNYVDKFSHDLSQAIGEWGDAFDRDSAINDTIVPEAGIDAEFDDSQLKMQNLEKKLGEYLRTYKKEYKSHEICFRDSGKEIFLIEMPIKIKNIPKDWQQMGSTSKVKRFWSPEVKKLVRTLMEQRETHKMLCEGLRFRMYEKFDKNYNVWIHTIRQLAQLDCLVALTKTSESIGFPSCRPEFVESETSMIDFRELRHPCFIGDNFIPNDVILGGEEGAKIGLLTGANAAGKSTLMRTTGLAVILSQLGCLVPAESAKLTPVDKIMTRLGANDNIMQGKSTFFVELSETKKILENATPNSLVILDELGRGGSSSDGYAIAESVLYHLATHIQSLGFFATHYGTLGLSFKTHPKIRPIRMAIVVDDAEGSRNITFLYKLEEGSASGSFGMNVASMCGISEDIVSKAEIAAKEYEHTSKLKKLTEMMLHSGQDGSSMNLSLGLQSDFSWFVNDYNGLNTSVAVSNENVKKCTLKSVFKMIDLL